MSIESDVLYVPLLKWLQYFKLSPDTHSSIGACETKADWQNYLVMILMFQKDLLLTYFLKDLLYTKSTAYIL